MFDSRLVSTFDSCRKSRTKVFVCTYSLLSIVFLCPIFFQNDIKKLEYSIQALIYLVWIAFCLGILLYGGFWKLIKLKQTVCWDCHKCNEKLNYRDIKVMLRFGKCPFCGEPFKLE